MKLRTLLVSTAQKASEDAAWSGVAARIRAHADYSLIAEAIGEEARGFASISRPDVIILGAGSEAEALAPALRAACPEARLLILDAPEGTEGAMPESELEAALDRLVREAQLKPAPSRRPGKLLVVHSPKGGAGCSQLATNLAIALVRGTARETILLDGGLAYGEQDLFLNLSPRPLSSVSAPHHVDAALLPHPTGIKLLASLPSEPIMSMDDLARLLGWLQQRDAWIVVDTHPALGDLNRFFLREASRVYLPMFLDLSHIRALQRELASCREAGIDTSRFEFVSWGERSEVSRGDASRTLKRPIDWSLPYDPGRVRAAINQGIPILQAEPRGAMAKELARMVAALEESPRTMALVAAQSNPWQGLLNWLRRGPEPNGFGV